MPTNSQSEQARLDGAKSKGATSDSGKRRSAKNSFKTGLYGETIAAYPKDLQDHYRKSHHAYREGYCPADFIEDDLVPQLAFNRARERHILRLKAHRLDQFPSPRPDQLERAIAQLERTDIRTLNALGDRRQPKCQLAAPHKIAVEWIAPRTRLPWRKEP